MQGRYDVLTSDVKAASIVGRSSYCAPLSYNEDRRPYMEGVGNDAACPSEHIITKYAPPKW